MTILSLSVSDQHLAILKQVADFRHVSLDVYLTEMVAKTAEIEEAKLKREDWNKRFLELVEQSTLDIGEIKWKREDLYDR